MHVRPLSDLVTRAITVLAGDPDSAAGEALSKLVTDSELMRWQTNLRHRDINRGRYEPTCTLRAFRRSVFQRGGQARAGNGSDGLRVIGRSTFERSGTVVIPSGSKSAVVPMSNLSATSLVLALMQNVAGGVAVKAAVPDPANSKFTVFLNKAPASPATATVAWFIVN